MTDRAKIESAAEKFVKRGKLQDAIHEYQKLISGDEQDIPILTIIGDLYIKSNQTDKAVSEFKKIAAYYEKRGLYSKCLAILKRIHRVAPDDLATIQKLADMHHDQGFSSEAMIEYQKLAKAYVENKRPNDAIPVFEKILKLSPEDLAMREMLADLYREKGDAGKAVEELNKVAEFQIRKKKLKEAGVTLGKAHELRGDDSRTLTNLIELYKHENKKKEALDLIDEILKKDAENLKALYLKGHLFFEDGRFKEAAEIYTRITSIRPKEAEALIKLGRIYIENNDLDKAFELFGPLVDTMSRKQKDDKAIGLLGLILERKSRHLPSLEKLAEIYRDKGQKDNLLLLARVLLSLYRKQDLKKQSLQLLGDLVTVFPENEEYYYEFRRLKDELGITEPDEGVEQVAIKVDEVKEIIETTLAKADLYVEQGLLRNAKRILENLRLRFPDEPKIKSRLEEIKQAPAKEAPGDIAQRVENVAVKESQFLDKIPQTHQVGTGPVFSEAEADEKLSAADIFAETDIIPLASSKEEEKSYFDLSGRINEELEAIKAVYNFQIRGDTTIVEKALTDIVSDFRKALDEKVDKEDFESHYNLGIAFLEQGLYDEAIEEGKLAADGKDQAVDSFGLISLCYRHKKDYPEALKWMTKALQKVDKDSEQAYALKYEMGALHEQMQDRPNALKYFEDVHKWNSEYRDVSVRIKSLKK